MKRDTINHTQSYMKKPATSRCPYQSPDIERIRLDNEISLVLQSSLPESLGDDPWSKVDDANSNDPFKTGLG